MKRNQDGQAVLLVNLGSPDSPSVQDVRCYLGEFLMDGHVIDVPRILRRIIVGGFVLPFRSKHAAEAYASIWDSDVSPLIVISREMQRLLAERLDVPVELAMRYRNPSIPNAIKRLVEARIDRVFVVPLYAHFAMSTVRSAVVAVEQSVATLNAPLRVRFADPFYQDESYITALAESARPYLEEEYDHLLVSYHGLPERHLKKTDPTGTHCLRVGGCCSKPSVAHNSCYRHQVLRTTELFARKLRIQADRFSVSFQSRIGWDSWLKPATADEVQRLAGAGVRRLLVICPAFVSDCLETLEEVGIGLRELFMEAGGESFELIPCLNNHPLWIDALETYCRAGLATDAAGRREHAKR